MGCSIGGRIVLNLAIDHASEFRALIGLEAADFQAPWYDTAWLNRPDVHGGEVCAALVSGLIAPQSPGRARMETLWHYKQGGPGVFKGDLYFYRVDGDLRGRIGAIDTTTCPLYLLTGEYDFSCSPEDTVRTASGITGAEVTVMEGARSFSDEREPWRSSGATSRRCLRRSNKNRVPEEGHQMKSFKTAFYLSAALILSA